MLSHPFNLITNWRQTTHQTVNFKKKQISKTWSQHNWFYWTKHPHYHWPYWYENSSTARTTFTRLCVEGTPEIDPTNIRHQWPMFKKKINLKRKCAATNWKFTLHRRAKLVTRLTEHLLTNDSDWDSAQTFDIQHQLYWSTAFEQLVH